jgi:hypothetical protein
VSLNWLHRIKNLEFQCPGVDCDVVHNWPRCLHSNNQPSREPFPLLICAACKLFIEMNPKAAYDFFVGCITESITIEVRVFRDYLEYAPEVLRMTLEEALQCNQVSAWNACAAISRKAVEVMATDLGGRGKSLFKKLQDLKDKGLVSERFWMGEDIVRDIGNLAVHYDPNSIHNCDRIDADCALAYAYEVSKQIYLRPRLDRFKMDFHKQRYLEFLEDIKWQEKYGVKPL